jgi:hypothetical protein
MPTPADKTTAATARRRRKADHLLSAAEGDQADWRGQFCGRRPHKGLRCDWHLPTHPHTLAEGFAR